MEHNSHGGRRVENTGSPERKRSTRKKRSGWHVAGTVFKVLGTLCLVGVLTTGIFAWIFMQYVKTSLAPNLQINLKDFTMEQTSIIYYQDSETGNWEELELLYGDENRIWLSYDQIPKYAIDATIAIEDKRFETHHGVDWRRTAGAVVNMFFGMRNTFGGSTITQQVVKNVTGYDDGTVKRKVTEIFSALELEKNYSKEEIMEVYLNKVTFGGQVYGFGAAAKTYFNKEASELSLAECASIIAITNNPSIYNPLFKNEVTLSIPDENGEYVKVTKDTVGWNKYRQETILYEMLKQGKITQEEYDQAVAEKLVFYGTEEYDALYGSQDEETEGEAQEVSSISGNKYWSWFVEQVFNDVKNDLMEQYGYNESTAVDLIYSAGYKIYATIDPEIQAIAESVYEDVSNLDIQSPKGQQLQSGITIMDPYTGEIKAIVGKIGEKEGNRVQSYAASTRPCGSAIKPLSIYAPALENEVITMASVYDDYPVSLNDKGTAGYPKNSPNTYVGLTTIKYAVQESKNTVAVRILREMGAEMSYDFMVNKLGFTTLVTADMDESPMAMGGLTYGVNTIEMAAAFSAFANNGVYTVPRTYTKVTQMQDNVEVTILDNEVNGEEDTWVAMSETTAYLMNELLKNVVSNGTGTAAKISGMTVAGKTGTTSNQYDRYFVGYTPYYCAAVWVGYPEFNEKISANGNPAAKLWQKVMSQVHEGLENKDFFERPAGLTSIKTCTASGLLAGEGCTSTQTVLVVSGTGPTETCAMHQTFEICTESGMLASPYCPAECRETRSFINYDRQTLYLGGSVTVDPVTGLETHTGTPITVPDDENLVKNIQAKGTCTTHTDPFGIFDPTNPDSPWYDPDYVPDPWNPTDPTDPTDPTVPVDPEGGTGGEPEEPEEPSGDGGDGGLSGWLDGLLGH